MLVSRLLLAALALSYFGSLIVAALAFPGGYDWRHTVMSSLASPVENPHTYQIVSYGMAISGVLLSLLAYQVRSSLYSFAPTWTAWAQLFFVAGGMLLTLSALITPGHHSFLGLPKAHAKFAQAAGVGFALGLALNLTALLRTPVKNYWARLSAMILICVPVIVFLTSWILLPMAVNFAPVSLQQDFRTSVVESLAFWEWIGSVSVYLAIVLVTTTWGHEKQPT